MTHPLYVDNIAKMGYPQLRELEANIKEAQLAIQRRKDELNIIEEQEVVTGIIEKHGCHVTNSDLRLPFLHQYIKHIVVVDNDYGLVSTKYNNLPQQAHEIIRTPGYPDFELKHVIYTHLGERPSLPGVTLPEGKRWGFHPLFLYYRTPPLLQEGKVLYHGNIEYWVRDGDMYHCNGEKRIHVDEWPEAAPYVIDEEQDDAEETWYIPQ